MTEKEKTPTPIPAGWKQDIDPTANVLKLVEEAVKRINDLVNAKTISDEKLDRADEKLRDYQIRIIGENTKSEIGHVVEVLNLHIDYNKQLDAKETDRLDAKALVVATQQEVDRERANNQANLLAKTVQDNFEMLRKSQEAQQLQLNERLTRTENILAETRGKTGVIDPMIDTFLEKLDKLLEINANRTGKELQTKNIWGYVVSAAVIFGAIVGAIIKISSMV